MRSAVIIGLVMLVCFTPPLRAGEGMTSVKTSVASATGAAWLDGKLWVTDRAAGTLVRVDPGTGETQESLPSPCAEASGLAGGEGGLWCVDTNEGKVYRVRLPSAKVEATLEVACSYPEGLAYDGRYLWMGCPRTDELMQVDPKDGTAVRKIAAPYKATSGLAFGEGYLWVIDRERDRLYMVQPESGWVLNSLRVKEPYPSGAAFGDGAVWITDYQRDTVTEIRLKELKPMQVQKTREQKVVFTHQVSNGGPGEVTDLRVWLAEPETRPGQELRSQDVEAPDGKLSSVKDRFGQAFRLARFDSLPPGRSVEVKLTARVDVQGVSWFVDPAEVKPLAKIPKKIRQLYLVDEEKYLINDPLVKKTAKEIVGREANAFFILQRVFEYVTENMSYKLSGGWNAAPFLLMRKTGSCSEYTILTIALLRAAGVPARYVGAYVIRGEDASVDYVFHRWVEAYIPGIGWIPVDPNKGDADYPADRARGIGLVDARFLVTTVSGGDSDVLAWQYNSQAKWSHTGEADVKELTTAEWEPAD